MQSNWQQVDPKYRIEVLALPWPAFNDAQKNKRLPLFISGWQEDIHDSHNWVQPFLVGDYAVRQNIPAELIAQFKELVSAGVAESDPQKRAEIYKKLQDMDYENVLAIRLGIPTTRWYEQRWVKGFYYNPIYPNEYYFYAYSKE
jgi:peptide/nickel transport system substrate-binding protein